MLTEEEINDTEAPTTHGIKTVRKKCIDTIRLQMNAGAKHPFADRCIRIVNSALGRLAEEAFWPIPALTGISVLLNTSLNRRGMPIVESPQDALDFFHSCKLDYLVLDKFIVSK